MFGHGVGVRREHTPNVLDRGNRRVAVRVHDFFGCTELSSLHLELACARDRACLRLEAATVTRKFEVMLFHTEQWSCCKVARSKLVSLLSNNSALRHERPLVERHLPSSIQPDRACSSGHACASAEANSTSSPAARIICSRRSPPRPSL